MQALRYHKIKIGSHMFLHPQTEDAVDFANRVKRKIAMAGGLVDLVWDGNLKRQVLYSTIFRRTLIGEIRLK